MAKQKDRFSSTAGLTALATKEEERKKKKKKKNR